MILFIKRKVYKYNVKSGGGAEALSFLSYSMRECKAVSFALDPNK